MSDTTVRRVRDDERAEVLAIVLAAAEAYRGVIPDDCFHDPYMSAEELDAEVGAGVVFWGVDDDDGRLLGVMGVQRVRDVDLVRHAYVLPSAQGRGVGSRLLAHLQQGADRPQLVGTWAAATWAVRFYERHGFVLEPAERVPALLGEYWTVGPRQVETSVVLRSR